MTRPSENLCITKDLMLTVNGILTLCEKSAFHLAETTRDQTADEMSAVARSIELSNKLLLQAMDRVNDLEHEVKQIV